MDHFSWKLWGHDWSVSATTSPEARKPRGSRHACRARWQLDSFSAANSSTYFCLAHLICSRASMWRLIDLWIPFELEVSIHMVHVCIFQPKWSSGKNITIDKSFLDVVPKSLADFAADWVKGDVVHSSSNTVHHWMRQRSTRYDQKVSGMDLQKILIYRNINLANLST